MEHDKSSKELVEELYTLFSTFKQKIEDPNYVQLENTLHQLVENQVEMKREMKELKKQLLNPFDGVIVETRKNSKYIEDLQTKEAEWNKIIDEHKALLRWKGTITKIGLGALGVLGSIISFLINKYLGK